MGGCLDPAVVGVVVGVVVGGVGSARISCGISRSESARSLCTMPVATVLAATLTSRFAACGVAATVALIITRSKPNSGAPPYCFQSVSSLSRPDAARQHGQAGSPHQLLWA